ncbi:hypothetical protein GJAV_G00007040 [Gymnothorax javanicus]|nr:hypothetical protein GJAV_G00007040 [Gymnothorax javanicus]
MSRSVFLLLSVLLVQGRECDHFMRNILSIEDERRGFRQVFPKDYKVTHHYNVNLMDSSDPCGMLREAYMLSHSWSQLLLHLWEENMKYDFITQLKDKLDSITHKKFPQPPDASVFPTVSSTPEELLTFTSTFFDSWLKKNCPEPMELCDFPLPSTFREEGKKSTPAPLSTSQSRVEEGKRQQRSGLPPSSLAASMYLSPYLSITFFCFSLYYVLHFG